MYVHIRYTYTYTYTNGRTTSLDVCTQLTEMDFYQCRFDVPQIHDVSSQDCIKLILILITF